MVWTFKKNNETNKIVEIGFSYGKDTSCDGVIVYDKEKDEFTMKKISKSCQYVYPERAFQYLWDLKDKLTEKERTIHLG